MDVYLTVLPLESFLKLTFLLTHYQVYKKWQKNSKKQASKIIEAPASRDLQRYDAGQTISESVKQEVITQDMEH